MNEAVIFKSEHLSLGASGIVEQYEGVVTRVISKEHFISWRLEIEARIFQHLGSHSRVVRILSWDSERPVLRTEYMRYGNLKMFISSKEPSTQEKCY
jgi:hypothetical protein